MRQNFIAGNWKMNLTRGESIALARQIEEAILVNDIDVAV